MSLLDALLLDPAPFAVWIACRTDGVKGSGTASDPYDGSTAAKFDAVMNGLSANTHIRIAPGTFQTSGYAAGVSGGWQPKAGMKICGAGMGATTLQLTNTTTTNAHYFAVGAPTTTLLDYFELSDLTIDCALPSNQSVACGAARVMGNHVRIRDVKCVNWGSRITTQPGFVIALVVADPDTGAPVLTADDAGIEGCIAVSPSANNTVSGAVVNVFHVGGREVTGAALTQFGRGPFIRNCFVDGGSPTSPVAEYRGLSMGACQGGVVEGNQVHNIKIGGPYQEKLNTREIIVRNNTYRNVIKGPFWNLGSSSSIGIAKLVVEGNQIQLIADSPSPTPVGIQLGDPTTVVTPPPYPHGQAVVRRNVIRYVDSTVGSFNGYGIAIAGASAAIISDNVLELTPADPIRNRRYITRNFPVVLFSPFLSDSSLSAPFFLSTGRCASFYIPNSMSPRPNIPAPPVSRRSFLKNSMSLAMGAPLLPGLLRAQAPSGKVGLMAYVGTFSSPLRDVLPTQVDLPPGNGRGIHLFQVNRTTGALTPSGLYELGTSPSCLVLNAAGTHLYSANETDRIGDNKEGTVSAFAISRGDGQLKLLNTVRSGGAGPTYVSIHPSRRFLLVANYFGGSVAVLPILPDGRLGDAVDVKVDAGKLGPARATNAPPGSFAFSGHDRTHAHMIQSDPSGRFVLHVDLGLDQILVWKFDQQKGVLTPNDPAFVAFPAGDGPRHFHFHPNGRWFYSIQEEGSNIVLFDYEAAGGRLAARQTISSLPPGFAGSNFCSEILVSADGRFVYAGNRLHDSIGIFAVGRSGELTFVSEEWTRGNYPRSFNFDPTGRFLYSCNQRGDNIAVFRVDRKTGGLAFTGHYAPVGNPSIIVFHDLAKSG